MLVRPIVNSIESSYVNQKNNLPDQISFLLHLDEVTHIIQAAVNLRVATATIHNRLQNSNWINCLKYI